MSEQLLPFTEDEERALDTLMETGRLTMILSVAADGQVDAFAETMAIREGHLDARDFLSLLLDEAIRRRIAETGFTPDQIIRRSIAPPEPDPQLHLDLDDDIPF